MESVPQRSVSGIASSVAGGRPRVTSEAGPWASVTSEGRQPRTLGLMAASWRRSLVSGHIPDPRR